MIWLLTLILGSAIIGWGYSLKYLEQLEKERKDRIDAENEFKQEIFDLLNEIHDLKQSKRS